MALKGGKTLSAPLLLLVILCLTAFLTIPNSAYATTTTIQPSSEDSWISESEPDTNHGSENYLAVRSYVGDNSRCLIRFNLSSIPAGVTIQSAQLRLYMFEVAPSPSRTYQAYRITSSWTELGVTWNNTPTVADTPTASVSTTIEVWLSWDITSDVQAWVDGSARNYGTLIKDAEESNDIYYAGWFHSKESSETTLRPKLEVTYTPFDFSVSASPTSQTINQGRSTTYTVTVTLVSGSAQLVSLSLSGLPSGATGTFNPSTVTPTGTSTLTVSTTGSTPVGAYNITITGTGGGLTRQTTVTLTITAAPDFSISATPPSQTVTAGMSTTYTITLTSLAGFSQPVSMGVTGLPTDATGTFNPSTVTPTRAGTSTTLTISTASTASGGTYTLTITGTGGGLTRQTTVTFVVSAKMASTITISVSSTTVNVGGNVVIEGSISPVRAGVTVTIQYRPSGGSWSILRRVTTSAAGSYTYTWMPSTQGTYEVKARWGGDTTTQADESDMRTITVQPAPPLIPMELLIGLIGTGAAATCACVGLVAYLKKPESIPEIIRASIQNILGRGAQESEIRSFYEGLRLVRLGSLISIVDRVDQFWSVREMQKARSLLGDTASLLKEFSKLYSEANRFREAFEGLSIEFSKLYETIEEDPEFPLKLRQLKAHLTEVDQAAEFYEKIAEELNVFKDYATLLKRREVV